MSYYFSKKVKGSFVEAEGRVRSALKKEGFGVLTEIDVKSTLEKKLGVEFRDYKILGACNPSFAYQALLEEDKIGTMLPCSVVVQALEAGQIEVSVVDPLVAMQAIDNPGLYEIAQQVRDKLNNVITSIN